MKTRAIASAAMIVAASLSAPAFAESGPYIGTSIGQTKFSVEDDTDYKSFDNKDTSWKLYAGYSFNEHVALELTYHDFGKLKFEEVPFGKAELEIKGYSASVLGRIPVSDSFGLFGRLGFIHVTGKEKADAYTHGSNTNEAIYGVGADYSLTESLLIRAEWEHIRIDDDKLNTLSAGVAYNF